MTVYHLTSLRVSHVPQRNSRCTPTISCLSPILILAPSPFPIMLGETVVSEWLRDIFSQADLIVQCGGVGERVGRCPCPSYQGL